MVPESNAVPAADEVGPEEHPQQLDVVTLVDETVEADDSTIFLGDRDDLGRVAGLEQRRQAGEVIGGCVGMAIGAHTGEGHLVQQWGFRGLCGPEAQRNRRLIVRHGSTYSARHSGGSKGLAKYHVSVEIAPLRTVTTPTQW